MSGRGSTGTGRRAMLPSGLYTPTEGEHAIASGLTVRFYGEDGRTLLVDVAKMALPGWHTAVAEALSLALGPTGRSRTLSSAKGLVTRVRSMLRSLSELPDPPTGPPLLETAHLQSVYNQRRVTQKDVYAWRGIALFGQFLTLPPLVDTVNSSVIDYTCRQIGQTRIGQPGYSDGEFDRILSAARSDITALRDRIRLSEAAIGQTGEREGLEGDKELVAIAESGVVPPSRSFSAHVVRLELASRLYMTIRDLAPMLVLMVALTGRNIETIKELPWEHRILETRAVEVRVIKRRRGNHRWFETATWEIGPPGRELHYPGGLYLLLHELTTRSRNTSGSASVWSIWRSGHNTGLRGIEEHFDPFARELTATAINLAGWRTRHCLHADVVDGTPPAPLAVTGNRIKTTADVRRTKQIGGHLPSAARSNTIPVLFRNYLRGDPTTQEWAHTVVAAAVSDAESSALAAHRRALHVAGGTLNVQPERSTTDPDGETPSTHADAADTAWSACRDHEHHPATGRSCRASFLDCFHCGNCVVTPDHLPGLLGLLDALAARRDQLSEADWWVRYGPTWAAIRHDVLSKFNRSEILAATEIKPTDALLDLVESPWEQT